MQVENELEKLTSHDVNLPNAWIAFDFAAILSFGDSSGCHLGVKVERDANLA